jgi:hypothetical protein
MAALFLWSMLCRVRNSRGRPMNVPAAFIHPCQPIVAKQPPSALSALAFDILMHDGDDVRRQPFAERRARVWSDL